MDFLFWCESRCGDGDFVRCDVGRREEKETRRETFYSKVLTKMCMESAPYGSYNACRVGQIRCLVACSGFITGVFFYSVFVATPTRNGNDPRERERETKKEKEKKKEKRPWRSVTFRKALSAPLDGSNTIRNRNRNRLEQFLASPYAIRYYIVFYTDCTTWLHCFK